MKLIFVVAVIAVMTGCKSDRQLVASAIAYQSVRVEPDTAKLAAAAKGVALAPPRISATLFIAPDGRLDVQIANLTDEVMTIDLEQALLLNSDGYSVQYAGRADGRWRGKEPIAPRGKVDLMGIGKVEGLGCFALSGARPGIFETDRAEESPVRFTFSVPFRLARESDYTTLTVRCYLNSQIVFPVLDSRRMNSTLREIYAVKPDAVREQWWMLCIPNNVSTLQNGSYSTGQLIQTL